MEAFVFVAVLVGLALVGAAQASSGRPVRSRWRGLAEECGLTDIRAAARSTHALRASLGTLDVLIEESLRSSGQHGTRVIVRGLSRFVAFRPEGVGTRLERALGARDLEVGDPDFDRELYVLGSARILRAVLDAGTRTRLRHAFARRVVDEGPTRSVEMSVALGDGAMTIEFSDKADSGREPQPATLRSLLELAQQLQEPADLIGRLAQNALQDPLPTVRGLVLGTLERDAPEHALTRATMTQALRDADGEVRLQAAFFLGEDGRPTLEELAADGTIEDSVSARAIQRLGEHLPFERARGILVGAVEAQRFLTARAAAGVLGTTGSPAAEEPLLGALDRADVELRVAVAEALAAVGTARSVLPLKTVEQGTRGRLAKAAREAVAHIQARLTGARPGQLALAEHREGQITLSEDEHGRLRLPDSSEES